MFTPIYFLFINYGGNLFHKIDSRWDKLPAKVVLSCIFLIGWPFRMSYKGRVGKHNVEVKKAVFVEYSSQDEGVSLSATPGSSANNNHNAAEQQNNRCQP
jgi:hypothetical protein